MLSFVVPTHDRPQRLRRTLAALGTLDIDPLGHGGAEVIVIDNASEPPVPEYGSLPNGIDVRTHRNDLNHGAAGRNLAAETARGDWLVMLDDDSHPVDARFAAVLAKAPPDVAAVGAEIFLPDGTHEAGGLPEVFIGCGVAIRRRAFVDAGGYDPSFHYYVEEYDLCAKLLQRGWRVVHDRRFRVRHAKSVSGRDMNLILKRLVRNNGWVEQRYAPDPEPAISRLIERYRHIARKEHAEEGFAEGLAELRATVEAQPRAPLDGVLHERFTGLHQARSRLEAHPVRGRRIAIVARGKHDHVVEHAAEESGAVIVGSPADAEMLLIGTLSPGPMLDEHARWQTRSPLAVLTPGIWHGDTIESAAGITRPAAARHV